MALTDFRSEMTPNPPLAVAEGNALRQFLFDTLQTLALALVLFVAINFVSARIRVVSISMENTLHPGDFVLVNRLAYKLGDIERGDVVIFDPPVASPDPYVKRVIGLPGEMVHIDNNKVYVNDVRLQESYLDSDFHSGGTWHVPEDAVFVMGDNRNYSSDSRDWGFLPLDNIIGRALFV
ncbi:MAG TPA: signal peptidase I, partial [Anaerolineales bacterium]|nr:signal peptidase I [Anaerolineales bacterium]